MSTLCLCLDCCCITGAHHNDGDMKCLKCQYEANNEKFVKTCSFPNYNWMEELFVNCRCDWIKKNNIIPKILK